MTRTVLVTGLPEGSTDKEVYHHFQKKKNGGAEIKEVKLRQEKNEAAVIFEDIKGQFLHFYCIRPRQANSYFSSSTIDSNTILVQLSLNTVT